MYENQYINQILAERCKQFILDNTSLVPLELCEFHRDYMSRKLIQARAPIQDLEHATCLLSTFTYFDSMQDSVRGTHFAGLNALEALLQLRN